MENSAEKVLVSKVARSVRCEVGVCKNKAVFAIGPAGKRHICYNVCEDCAKIIAMQLAERFPELATDSKDGQRSEPPAEGEPPAENEQSAEGEANEQPTEGASAEPAVYTCKYCGSTFAKPDELKRFRSHQLQCAVKASAAAKADETEV